MIRLTIPALLAALSGCAAQSPVLQDGQVGSPSEAYVLINPHYQPCNGRFDLELTRVEADGQRQAEFYPWMTDSKLVILRVKPGFYFLSALKEANCPMSYTFDWRNSLFEAKAGKLTYPGDWTVLYVPVSSSTEGTLGGGSARVSFYMQITVEPNPKIDSLFRQEFPVSSRQLTPILARVQTPH